MCTAPSTWSSLPTIPQNRVRRFCLSSTISAVTYLPGGEKKSHHGNSIRSLKPASAPSVALFSPPCSASASSMTHGPSQTTGGRRKRGPDESTRAHSCLRRRKQRVSQLRTVEDRYIVIILPPLCLPREIKERDEYV